MDTTFPFMSPRTRRLHRGRPSTVLSNMTASNMTNMVPTAPSTTTSSISDSSFEADFGPSPDEMIINARGRRALPLTFSPDVHHYTPPRGSSMGNQRTISKLARPNGGIARLLLPTRTSPRKRLTLTDSPPTSMAAPLLTSTPSPEQRFLKKSPAAGGKKTKTDDFLATNNTNADKEAHLSTPVLLKGLSRAQLLDVLNELIIKKPEIENDLRQCLPKPDLNHMEERLNYLKRNIYKALPNTRLESKTDSMAYSRVAQHLLAFKKELIDQGKRLVEANAWSSLVDHSIMAWNFVLATPTWDNAPHNNVKKQCFKALAANINMSLKKGSWTSDSSFCIKTKLLPLEKDHEDIGPCVKHLDLIINGNNNVTSTSTQE